MTRRLAPAAVTAAALAAACGPAPAGEPVAATAPTGAAASGAAMPLPQPAVRLAGVDLTRPLRALGNEPFWGVDVEPGRLVLTRPDHAPVEVRNPGVESWRDRVEWFGRADDGREFRLTLREGPCSDGMSDRTYPLASQVDLAGETLRGCAATRDFVLGTDEQGRPRS